MKKTLIFAALVAALCSCSSEQVTNPASPQGDVKLGLNGSVTGTISTKAEAFLPEKTEVGVYAWQTSDVPVGSVSTLTNTTLANALYTVNNLGGFTSNSYIQIYNGRTYKACAYAPYKAVSSISLPSVSFTHLDDVLYAPESVVDFKTDVTPITASTALPFVHKMSQIKLTLTAGAGTPSLDNVTVKISGFYNSCSMNLATGVITAGSDKTAVTNQVQKLTGSNLSSLTPFCVIPGNMALTIEINADGVNYKKVYNEKTFKASESNELNLKLNRTTSSLDVTGKVVDWTNVEVANIDVPAI